ncbi:MAG: PEP-CTERM sorting domain-containing protein [Armatimonadota bacterium]|nr:PEP-CTERM sorting domain-containing protein [Armatimonadota bacterium]
MKKVLVITCVLVLVALVAGSAFAAENNWRFRLRADNNAGAYMSDSQIGIYPSSLDGYDSQDGAAQFLADPYGMTYANWATEVIPGRTEAFMKSIKAPIQAGQPVEKKWDLRVYVLRDGTNPYIRLNFMCISTLAAMAPPSSINGVPLVYYIKMVNNRGIEGAPANGTEWIIPVPTVYVTNTPWFTLVLPTGFTGTNGPNDIMLTVSHPDNAANEGYVMEYGFRPVPEPSTLLAFGTGVAGLVGFVMRRRRA